MYDGNAFGGIQETVAVGCPGSVNCLMSPGGLEIIGGGEGVTNSPV